MHKAKKIILLVSAFAVVLGGIYFGLRSLKLKNQNSKTAGVYSVAELGYDASNVWDSSTLSGSVTVNSEQKVYVGKTQVVSEIKVTEGQSVKAGDVLLVYDTTANDLQLELRKSELELSRVAIIDAQRELEKLKNTTPLEDVPTTEAPTTEAPTTEAPTTEAPTTEAPTTETPTTEAPTTEAPTIPETPAAPTPETPPTGEMSKLPVQTEVLLTGNPDALDEGNTGEGEEELPPTREELKKMIAEKEQEITSMQTQYEIAQVELQIEEMQNASGEVLANFDGVVKTIISADEAASSGEPVILVSAADGYLVESQIGELALSTVQLGDTVSMYCYDTGMTYEGTITEISTFPDESNGYYGSKMETYYPIKIALNDTSDVSQYMYMEITLSSDSEGTEGGFYLSKAFMKQEGSNYYVMKDVDGRLEKTYIKVGNKTSGDAVLILGGVTMQDYIAFPYLEEAVDGVKTVQKSIEELYE